MSERFGPRRSATPVRELTRIDERTLAPHELVRIRDSLPEAKRWPFMLALDERIFDQVVAFDKPAGEQPGQ